MEQGNRKLEVLQVQDEDESCKTFILKDEDHTLGNALRYIISNNSDVEHCGYSVTHPSIRDINFRIQTKRGVSATDVFRKGLEDLYVLCDHMKKTFKGAVKEYKDSKCDDIKDRDSEAEP